MTYRDDLAALSARHDALSAEVAHKQRELAQTSQLLDDAKARMHLPVLDNIRIASPCSADWAKMTGDERARHCGDCKKTVFNLSDMTREEAEALIVAKAGRLCVRYYQRKDGTILLADCTIGVAKKRKRRLIAAGAAALLAGGGVFAAFKLTKHARPDVMMGSIEATEPVMGKIAPEHPIEMKGELAAPVEPTR